MSRTKTTIIKNKSIFEYYILITFCIFSKLFSQHCSLLCLIPLCSMWCVYYVCMEIVSVNKVSCKAWTCGRVCCGFITSVMPGSNLWMMVRVGLMLSFRFMSGSLYQLITAVSPSAAKPTNYICIISLKTPFITAGCYSRPLTLVHNCHYQVQRKSYTTF